MMTIIQVLAVAFSISAHAEQREATIIDQLQAVQGALNGAGSVVAALEKKDFMGITQEQMGKAVAELVQDLKDRNDQANANELAARWEQTSLMLELTLSKHDLGDHAPLLPWLEDFFTKLANQYGTIIYSLPYVADLRTLNFAIPVVFTPKGTWRIAGQDNRIEYRKHFIPFANIVTYYASYYGCVYILTQNGLGQLKQLCGKAAEQLKFVMGRYIAPQISDWIFQATGASFQLADKTFTYSSAEQLLIDINQ